MCKMDIVERANESGAIITRYSLNGNLTKTAIKAMFHQFDLLAGEDGTLNEIRYAQEGKQVAPDFSIIVQPYM
ncbi:hypothetical protein V5799_003342 [Amblyomma americanum]|uniref:Uncharacterized protein n=1 Tax=Amblyomma americanum TaxID=6943 RepID=A0AAQ4D986_AMBAM